MVWKGLRFAKRHFNGGAIMTCPEKIAIATFVIASVILIASIIRLAIWLGGI